MALAQCPQYRIDRGEIDRGNMGSAAQMSGSLLPPSSVKDMYSDFSLAVAVAVKSVADPSRQRITVVHVPTGEIVFQTANAR